jgi:hypothetical protein
LTKDNQNIDEIEILPKTNKKNKIVPTSKKGNGFSINKAENQHRHSKPSKCRCYLCKVNFQKKWDLELHDDFFHYNQYCKKSENRDDYNKVSEKNILSQNVKFKSYQSSENYCYERLNEEKESYECMMCFEKFAKESQLLQHTCKAYIPKFSKPNPPEFRKLNPPEFSKPNPSEFEQFPSNEQTVELSFDDVDEDISFQQPELTIYEDFFELNPCN